MITRNQKIKRNQKIRSYTIVDNKPIGKGLFGEVWKVKGDDGSLYALKTISMEYLDPEGVKRIKYENRIMKEISLFPNCTQSIACYVDSFECLNGKSLCIVMEYIKGFNLQEINESSRTLIKDGKILLSESIIKLWLKQLLEALIYLHGKKVVHRDIKPDNIMVNENLTRATLVDFGFADIYITNGKKKCESPNLFLTGHNDYFPPEIIKCRFGKITYYENRWQEKQDIWALGLTFWQVASEGPLDFPKAADIGEKSKFDPVIRDFKDASITNAIDACLIIDPDERPTAKGVLKILLK